MKEKCRDLVGKMAILIDRIETVGGEVYPAGSRMRIVSTHRGKYHLETRRKRKDVHGQYYGIRGLRRYAFKLEGEPDET
jgi:hypothetical protein